MEKTETEPGKGRVLVRMSKWAFVATLLLFFVVSCTSGYIAGFFNQKPQEESVVVAKKEESPVSVVGSVRRGPLCDEPKKELKKPVRHKPKGDRKPKPKPKPKPETKRSEVAWKDYTPPSPVASSPPPPAPLLQKVAEEKPKRLLAGVGPIKETYWIEPLPKKEEPPKERKVRVVVVQEQPQTWWTPSYTTYTPYPLQTRWHHEERRHSVQHVPPSVQYVAPPTPAPHPSGYTAGVSSGPASGPGGSTVVPTGPAGRTGL